MGFVVSSLPLIRIGGRGGPGMTGNPGWSNPDKHRRNGTDQSGQTVGAS